MFFIKYSGALIYDLIIVSILFLPTPLPCSYSLMDKPSLLPPVGINFHYSVSLLFIIMVLFAVVDKL